MIERERALESALSRASVVAEHLFQMIEPQVWRDTGGDDGQGHYEGDYLADRAREEIRAWAVLAGGRG